MNNLDVSCLVREGFFPGTAVTLSSCPQQEEGNDALQNSLSDYVLSVIFSNMSAFDRLAARHTCRRWHRLIPADTIPKEIAEIKAEAKTKVLCQIFKGYKRSSSSTMEEQKLQLAKYIKDSLFIATREAADAKKDGRSFDDQVFVRRLSHFDQQPDGLIEQFVKSFFSKQMDGDDSSDNLRKLADMLMVPNPYELNQDLSIPACEVASDQGQHVRRSLRLTSMQSLGNSPVFSGVENNCGRWAQACEERESPESERSFVARVLESVAATTNTVWSFLKN